MQTKYEYLDSLIGGSFHQDFDIFGDTLEEIIGSFRNRASAEGVQYVQEDIRRYLNEHRDEADFDQRFYETFQWGLVENAFGTPRDFLTKVAELLAAPTEQRRAG